jgi:hypothetical protein
MKRSELAGWRKWVARWIASIIVVTIIWIPMMLLFRLIGWEDRPFSLEHELIQMLPMVVMAYLMEEAKDFYAREKAKKQHRTMP